MTKKFFSNLVIDMILSKDKSYVYYSHIVNTLRRFGLSELYDVEDIIAEEKLKYILRRAGNQVLLFQKDITFESLLSFYLKYIDEVEEVFMIDEMIIISNLDKMLLMEIDNIKQRINNIKNGKYDIDTQKTLEYAIKFLYQLLMEDKKYICSWFDMENNLSNSEEISNFIFNELELVRPTTNKILNDLKKSNHIDYESSEFAPYLYSFRADEDIISFPSTEESRARLKRLSKKSQVNS